MVCSMIKTNVTSDLHGILPPYVEEFDLMLICGDVCPAHDHYFSFQKEWSDHCLQDHLCGTGTAGQRKLCRLCRAGTHFLCGCG